MKLLGQLANERHVGDAGWIHEPLNVTWASLGGKGLSPIINGIFLRKQTEYLNRPGEKTSIRSRVWARMAINEKQ